MILKHQYISLGILIALVVLVFGIPVAGCSGATQTLHKELAKAREDLRISKAGEEKIEADLMQLKQSDKVSAQTILDIENYHGRIKAIVSENRRIVYELETLQKKYGTGNAVIQSNQVENHKTGFDPDIPEESISNPVADLDRQLDQSLAAFDKALLKEMELIKIQSSEKMQDLSDDAEAARQRLKEQGIDIDAQPDPESEKAPADQHPESGSDPDQDGTGNQSESGGLITSGPKDSTDTDQIPSGTEPKDNGRVTDGAGGLSKEEERRYGYGKDDDIVARQLREAAQKETDPELRKKLWNEYEAYKKNR